MVVDDPEQVLRFWFPQRMDDDLETHKGHVVWQMRGGADAAIVERFEDTTRAAARGELDHWASTPRGRLALLIVLDQFSRSVFRERPEAFAQDAKAAALAAEGIACGHFAALQTPWERTFVTIALSHAEGPDHLERLDQAIALADEIAESAPEHLRPLYAYSAQKPREHREVIARFGRHPHRNATLGRDSTPEEEVYLSEGRFPHQGEIVLEREGES